MPNNKILKWLSNKQQLSIGHSDQKPTRIIKTGENSWQIVYAELPESK